MKRLSIIALLLALLTLPAQAETWFPDVSGTLIHRDPFCIERILSLESFFLPAIQVSPVEIISADESAAAREIRTADASYAACPHCDGPSVKILESSELYYNPAGGTKLHRNPECPFVSRKYWPMRNIREATGAIPQERCYACGPRFMTSPADAFGWNAAPEEKALFLPGVWTVPSQEAISPEEAYAIAHDWAAKMIPGSLCSVCVMHYDYGLDIRSPHPTYKVLVTTTLRHPVCILYLEAKTGEIYAVERAAEFLSE